MCCSTKSDGGSWDGFCSCCEDGARRSSEKVGDQSNATDHLPRAWFAALRRLLGWCVLWCAMLVVVVVLVWCVCDAGPLWTSHTRVREAELFCRCEAVVREPEVQRACNYV